MSTWLFLGLIGASVSALFYFLWIRDILAPGQPALPVIQPPVQPVVTPTATTPVQRPRTKRTPPPTRVAYTRHATADDSDDRIINGGWHRFLIAMLYIGGGAVLFLILLGGFQWGKSSATSVSTPSVTVPVIAPVIAPATPTPPATPTQVVTTTPAPPTIKVEVAVAPIKVETVPLAPAVSSPTKDKPAEVSDAEQRNEALKERLRKRYGI